ncbi:MAG TPA: DALR anticodon-binding domain-containing protein, partial [Candidatus Woesebacteria bacterium]|nr:DALR anticodon-binding domain-containing protein [Candidatus Woesebacteria bacterium]
REIVKFKAKIIEAAERFNPGVLAEFLLNVARKYNEFYAKNRIIGSDNEAFRIFLTRSTASLLHLGLELLGIKTLTKM